MKKLWLSVVVVAAFICGYGAVADAFPAGGLYGRGEFRGYFTNVSDSAGTDVFPRIYQSGTEAFPNSINSASEFINFVKAKYSGGTTQEKTGAAFIMETMLNIQGSSSDKTPSQATIDKWADLVTTAANHGHVTWRTNFTYTINSYYQGGGDDAFYDNGGTFPAMVFEDEFGRIAYVIKWQCANPVGNSTTFGLTLEQPWEIAGRTTVTNGAGQSAGQIDTYVGDTLNFRHWVRNTVSTAATNPTHINAWSAQNLDGGAFTTITPSGDHGVFAASEEKNVINDPPYIVPNLAVGTNICRVVFYQPLSSSNNASDRGNGVCARVQASYDLTPTINVQVNGGAVTGNRAEAGDTVTFTYAVNNNGGTGNNIGCTIYGLSRNGYYAVPNPADSTSDAGFTQPAHGCPRSFPGSTNTTLVAETVPAASVVVNKSICRSLYVSSPSPGASALGVEACVYVVQKPYARSYGGDVAAGSGFDTASGACTTYDDAAIIGWNKRAGSAWAGAGVQHGARATGTIFDFATSLGGAAGPPQSLSFINTTTDTANGNFGGNFDWAPCLPDFYGGKPSSTTPLTTSLTSLTDGVYGGVGNFALSGDLTVGAGNDITVYVEGNVLINGNIRYASNWTIAQMPTFRMIVLGNIYIDNDVDQLDGLYVAQPIAATGSGGALYTCTTGGFYSQPPLNGTLLTACDNKLTVNGAFLARHLRLLRTIGTLRQSAAGEASTSGNIAEVFNYSPIMWIPQPTSSGAVPSYDAITSLPPIL